jgi:hypothetical protein
VRGRLINIHTQNIENRWKVVKQMLRKRGGIRRDHIKK